MPAVNPDEGPCGHGAAEDGPEAASAGAQRRHRLRDGQTNIRDFGEQLLADGRISMARIDDAVRRILRVKFRAGLFDDPYVDVDQAEDRAAAPGRDRATARRAAGRSMVLLKNEGAILPLTRADTAVIGPLGNNQHDMLGPWWGRGEDEDVVSRPHGIKARSPGATFAEGCALADAEPPDKTPRAMRLRRRLRRGGCAAARRPTRSCSRSARRVR